jgi:hypothetical protein
VTGTVNDQTGTGVANAAVVAENATGLSQSATTDAQGLYVLELPPGPYTFGILVNGLKVLRVTGVLSPGQVLTLGTAGSLVAQANTSAPPEVKSSASAATATAGAGEAAAAAVARRGGKDKQYFGRGSEHGFR